MYKYMGFSDAEALENERLRREWRATDRQLINVLSQPLVERIKREFRKKRGKLTMLQFLSVMEECFRHVVQDKLAFLSRLYQLCKEIDVDDNGTIDWDEWSSYLIQMSQSNSQGASFFASNFTYEVSKGNDPSAFARTSPVAENKPLILPAEDETSSDVPLILAIEKQSQMLRIFSTVEQRSKLILSQCRSCRHDTAFQPHEVLAMEAIPAYGLVITSSQESRTGPYYLNAIDATHGQVIERVATQTAQDVLCWNATADLIFSCGPDGRDIRGYNPNTFEIRKRLLQDSGAVRTMASYPDELTAIIIAGSDDGCLRVYDLRQNYILEERTIHAHDMGVKKLRISKSLDSVLSYGMPLPGKNLSPLRINTIYVWPLNAWIGDLERQDSSGASANRSRSSRKGGFRSTSEIKPKVLSGHRYALVGADMQGSLTSFPHIVSGDRGGYIRVWDYHSASCLQIIAMLAHSSLKQMPTPNPNSEDSSTNNSAMKPSTMQTQSRPGSNPSVSKTSSSGRKMLSASSKRQSSRALSRSGRSGTIHPSTHDGFRGRELPSLADNTEVLSYGRAMMKLRPHTSAGEAERLYTQHKTTLHRQFAIDALGCRESEGIIDSRVFPYSRMTKASPRRGPSKVETFLSDPDGRKMSVSQYSRAISQINLHDLDDDLTLDAAKDLHPAIEGPEEPEEQSETLSQDYRTLSDIQGLVCLPAEYGGRERCKTVLLAGNVMQLLLFTVHAPDVGPVLSVHFLQQSVSFCTVHANVIIIWDALSGRPMRVFPSEGLLGDREFVAAHPDDNGRRLIITDNANTLHLINCSSGARIKSSKIFREDSIQSVWYIGYLNETAITSSTSEVVVVRDAEEEDSEDRFIFRRIFGLPSIPSIRKYIEKLLEEKSYATGNFEATRILESTLKRLLHWIRGKGSSRGRRRRSAEEAAVYSLFAGSTERPITTTVSVSEHLNLLAMAIRIPAAAAGASIFIWDYGSGTPVGICFPPHSGTPMEEIIALQFLDPYPLLVSLDISGTMSIWAVPPSKAKFTLRGQWELPTSALPTAMTVEQQQFDAQSGEWNGFRVHPMQHGTIGLPRMIRDALFHQGFVIWVGDESGGVHRFIISLGALAVALLPDIKERGELIGEKSSVARVISTAMDASFEEAKMRFGSRELSHKTSLKSRLQQSRISPARVIAVANLSITQEQFFFRLSNRCGNCPFLCRGSIWHSLGRELSGS
eukprot:gb/GECG01016475.1/.p1 GENE.gb/GECG01016475.1/~~gb/GECG01016475.1/.p1  ORF type:complete len:1216 (+),score=134.23 gb/GECG01016475.1/:1-3648(+)